jgi:hypothetical protein
MHPPSCAACRGRPRQVATEDSFLIAEIGLVCLAQEPLVVPFRRVIRRDDLAVGHDQALSNKAPKPCSPEQIARRIERNELDVLFAEVFGGSFPADFCKDRWMPGSSPGMTRLHSRPNSSPQISPSAPGRALRRSARAWGGSRRWRRARR